ncbi:mobilization protein, partial [Escherichia coli]|nr:mobilization protein [Escherichia coli]
EKSVKAELSASAKRISDAISAHEQGMTAAMQSNRLNVLRMVGRTWLTITMVSVLLIATSGSILWWQGQQILDNYTAIREQKSTQAMLSERNSGVQLSTCGEQRRRCVKVNPEAGRFGEDSSWMILAGK